MDTACKALPMRTTDAELATSLLWTAAAYDRLNEPSSLCFLMALDEALGQSAGAVAILKAHTPFAQALMQALYCVDPESPAYSHLVSVRERLHVTKVPSEKPTISRLQRAVTKVLAGGQGLQVVQEAELGGGVLLVDALIMPPKGSKLRPVAVEVDGPHHYLIQPPREVTGTTLFKRRLMDLAVQMGEIGAWVSVPYWEWNARKGLVKQQGLLCELLEARGVDISRYRAAA